jgi:hypothetical protein
VGTVARALLLAIVVASAAGCGETLLPVTFTATPQGIAIVARGTPGASLLVIADQPTGPHFLRTAPRFWTTVGPPGPDGTGGTVLGRATFGSTGTAALLVTNADLDGKAVLLQAVALAGSTPERPLGVSHCWALTWDGTTPVLRGPGAAVLRSPAGARLLAVAALIVAAFAARRLAIAASPPRRVILAVIAFATGVLLLPRIFSPATLEGARRDAPAPLFAAEDGPPVRPADFAPLCLLLALPAGLLLTRGMLPAGSRVARLGTAALAGLGTLACAAQSLAAVGLRPRWTLPVLAAASATLWIVTARGAPPSPAAKPKPRWLDEVVPVALAALLLAVPFLESRAFGVSEHDAVEIWAPRAARALDEAPYVLDHSTGLAHPEYPRGLGILTAAAGVLCGGFEPTLPRVVPLFLFFLTLLAAYDALGSRGNRAAGVFAVLILGAIPLLVHHASSGYADVALAGFVMLGTLGLTSGRDGGRATGLAIAGALGAIAMKDEGLAFAAGLALFMGWRGALAASIVAAPWVVARWGAPTEGVVSVHSAVQNVGMLLARFDQLVRETGHFMLGLPDPSPGSARIPDAVPGGDLVSQLTLLSCLVLVIGRTGSVRALPVGLLLLADVGAIWISPQPVAWHLATAANRLMIQALPLLVVAALDKASAPNDYPARTRT